MCNLPKKFFQAATKVTTEDFAQRCSVIKVFWNISPKFTGNHLCWGLRPATLLKTRLQHGCLSVNCVKFLRTPPAAASLLKYYMIMMSLNMVFRKLLLAMLHTQRYTFFRSSCSKEWYKKVLVESSFSKIVAWKV